LVNCVASAVTPYQADPVAWQLAHDSDDTTACPAAASDGVVVILKPPTAMLVAWHAVHPPVPSAMWLADPDVATVPGGTTIVVPYHAMPAAWQLWHDSALTAVWPVDDSDGVPVTLKPVPLSVSVTAWQATQSALLTGMWLPEPDVPSVPGGCLGCPPVPWLVPANGPLPAPWQVVQLSLVTAECTILLNVGPEPGAAQGAQ